MNAALWTLIRLNSRARLRRLVRGARTLRGMAFLGLGVAAFFAWLGPMIYRAMKAPPADAQALRIVAPFAILGICLGNLVASFGEQAVAFTPAEVDFLFPGPFTRRTLLVYKIVKTALGTLFTSVVFTIVLLRFGKSWYACFAGVWLTVQFTQLFAMTVMMVAQTVGERVYKTGRRTVLLVLLGLSAVALAPVLVSGMHTGPMGFLEELHATVGGTILLAPFDVFARTLGAANLWPELVEWGGLALLINLAMLAVVIGLDANYMETAAVVSRRRYERLRRMRGGRAGMATTSRRRLSVTPLPWLGGAGPIAWRQLTGAVRSSRRPLILQIIIAAIVVTMIFEGRDDKSWTAGPIVGAAVWMNMFFVTMLKFDFRDDLDRIDVLRALPVTPLAVAAGELAAPVVVMSALQALVLVAVGLAVKGSGVFVGAAAAFIVPVNILLVGLENRLFLMFPLRSAGLIAGDMQMVGRQMVVFFCKLLLLLIALTLAAAIGTVGFILGGKSWPVFGVFAWVALTLLALSMVPLVAHAFAKYDPALDAPI